MLYKHSFNYRVSTQNMYVCVCVWIYVCLAI